MLPIPTERLREEMAQISEFIASIKERIDAGIPGELPATEESQEIFQVQLRGELMLLSQRVMALAEVLDHGW